MNLRHLLVAALVVGANAPAGATVVVRRQALPVKAANAAALGRA